MNQTQLPIISVVMTVYNSEKYLVQAINSILAQSVRDFEFIIVNDGSTDRSAEILQQFAARDDRIRVVNRENGGVAVALNDGLAHAKGDYIARMDSDDISLHNRFASQLEYMNAHPECVALSCRSLTIDPDGCPIRVSYRPLTHEEIDQFHLNGFGGGLSGPAAFMRRSAVMAVGAYGSEFTVAEDYDLWLRLAEVGRLANLPDVLLFYREHATGLTQSRSDQRHLLTWKAQKAAHDRRHLPFEKSLPVTTENGEANLERRWANLALQAGYYGTARKYAWRQLVRKPAGELVRILAEATLRPAAEPVYDLIRGRRPRSWTESASPTSPKSVRDCISANSQLA